MLQTCLRRAVLYGRASRDSFVRAPSCTKLIALLFPAAHVLAYHISSTYYSEQACIPLRKQLKDEARAKQASLLGDKPTTTTAGGSGYNEWELTVGIEIHAQLNTARKLFSKASTKPTEEPNTHIAHFDLSVPGSLPVFQKATLIPALRAALALNCTIQLVSRFDRKHYFYHDQPAGYQITQYYEPFARDGRIVLNANDCNTLEDGDEVKIGIKQIQMEQDTAKTQDQDEETSLIDYNRAGLPLIEIISMPNIHSPEVASAYVRKVQAILLSIDAVTTGMEMGGLRADINVSVRRKDAVPGKHSYSGVTGLGQRTEIKNLSTLKGVEDAIIAERDRQISVLEAGGNIAGETRGWSVTKPGETRRLRQKEGEVDYRYMPDPDIPPLRIGSDVVAHLKDTLPYVPDQLVLLLTDLETYGLSVTDAKILLSLDNGERLDYFQDVVDNVARLGNSDASVDEAQDGFKTSSKIRVTPRVARLAANWVLQELGSLLSKGATLWSDNKVSAVQMSQIIHLTLSGSITGSVAKLLLKLVFDGDQRSISQIIEQDGLAFKPLSDEEYCVLATKIMDKNPAVVRDIQEKGKHGKVMFLVGQMMRQGEDGRIEAKTAERVLRSLLSLMQS